MLSIEQQKTEILEFLIANQDAFIIMYTNLITQRTKAFKENDSLFTDSINEDFSKLIKELICIEIAKAKGYSSDNIKEILEPFRVLEYLKLK